MLFVSMERINAWILVFILLLIEKTSLVQSTCNGFGSTANFTISFLEDIPDEDIKNITLAVKQAPSQVFLTPFNGDHNENKV